VVYTDLVNASRVFGQIITRTEKVVKMRQKIKKRVLKKVEYVQILTDKDWLRVYFATYRGKLKKFIVQYLSLINNRKRSIMRVDTCHGYPHKHTYYLKGKQAVIVLGKSEDLALVFRVSKQDIIKRFKDIKNNFLMN